MDLDSILRLAGGNPFAALAYVKEHFPPSEKKAELMCQLLGRIV